MVETDLIFASEPTFHGFEVTTRKSLIFPKTPISENWSKIGLSRGILDLCNTLLSFLELETILIHHIESVHSLSGWNKIHAGRDTNKAQLALSFQVVSKFEGTVMVKVIRLA